MKASEKLPICVLLALILMLSAVHFVGAVGVVGTIVVGGAPQGLAYDSVNSNLYVTNIPTS